jgi:probable phosphoglycerate mutase
MRAQETARPLASRLGLSIEIFAEIDELDTGAWTGRSFASLSDDPIWSLWNTTRSTIRPPNGESMQELQERAVDHIRKVAASTPGGHVALCSHAEVIRAIVLQALRLPLDDFHRVEIAPATISTIVVGHDGIAIIALNQPALS